MSWIFTLQSGQSSLTSAWKPSVKPSRIGYAGTCSMTTLPLPLESETKKSARTLPISSSLAYAFALTMIGSLTSTGCTDVSTHFAPASWTFLIMAGVSGMPASAM